jgi:hypothetical protein
MKQLAMACSCGYLSPSTTCTSVNFMFRYWSTECNFPGNAEEGRGGGRGGTVRAGLQEVRGDLRWLHHSPVKATSFFNSTAISFPMSVLKKELKNWMGNVFGMRFRPPTYSFRG